MGRQPLVAANWKMNGQRARIATLIAGIRAGLQAAGAGETDGIEIAVCPPYVYLEQVSGLIVGSPIALGAQNLATEDSGAYTGEISGPMLGEFGCRYVIVGHSERRNLFGENDARVAAKFVAAQRHGLTPILCVGEKAVHRKDGTTEKVIAEQLDAVLSAVGIEALANAVIAYEPIWAIGSGKTATPDQAQPVHAFIRHRLAVRDKAVADGIRIIYGGSVNAGNAKELFAERDIDGALVGGASLIAEEFLGIGKAAVITAAM
jgi:triosephosphate isomerase